MYRVIIGSIALALRVKWANFGTLSFLRLEFVFLGQLERG